MNALTRSDGSARRLWVASSGELVDGAFTRVEVLFEKAVSSVIVLRHDGVCRAYRNRCVHMPRELDCEANTVFDRTGRLLRCSFHGVVYDPTDGTSLSTICDGQRLTAIGVEEDEHGVWLVDKRVRTLASLSGQPPERARSR